MTTQLELESATIRHNEGLQNAKLRFDGADYKHERDSERLTGQIKRVFDLMRDEKFRSLSEISFLTGDGEASISAQLRNLRKPRFGGHEINKRYLGDGLYVYQLKEAK